MREQIYRLLSDYGLKDNEIEIYLLLVRHGDLTAYRIAKHTKYHRSTTYDILERLIAKGFITKIEKNNKKFFSANDVSRIITRLKDKESILLSILPYVESLTRYEEPSIRCLEDVGGQKQFNYNLFNLAKKREISFCYVLGNTPSVSVSSNIFLERLMREFQRAKNDIEYKGIWDSRFKNDPIITKYNTLGKNKFLPLPSRTGTVIYDGVIAFLFTQQKPYIIEIRNPAVFEEFKAYFLHLWSIAHQ